jgi:hypothetical protein
VTESEIDYSMVPIILACPMDPESNDAGASSVREFLAKIIQEVWTWEDSFSGKRPFGNSGWKWDIYTALINAEMIEYDVDDEDLSPEQRRTIDAWVLGAIWLMGRGPRE